MFLFFEKIKTKHGCNYKGFCFFFPLAEVLCTWPYFATLHGLPLSTWPRGVDKLDCISLVPTSQGGGRVLLGFLTLLSEDACL